MDGWIKLYRKLIEWEWYKDTNVKVVFLHLLLLANHEDKKWQGITIKRGQLVTSYDKIASGTGLSLARVRTAISKLKMTHEITTQITNKYTLVTIENFDKFQGEDKKIASNLASNSTTKSQANNNKQEIKNDKKIRNIYSRQQNLEYNKDIPENELEGLYDN